MEVNYRWKKHYKTAKYPIRQPKIISALIWVLSKFALIGKKYKVNSRYFEEITPEWIWVDAYKGTDANMVCKGKQYRMNVEDNYSGKVALGSKGYHVCIDLKHVFKDYDYDFRNRFFKVRALVNAKDYQHRNPNNTTLVAKAIKFVEEITDAPSTIAAKRSAVR